MLGTNRQFETLLRHIDGQIVGMEQRLVNGASPGTTTPALDDMWRKRRALKLLLLNRKVEASKPVVDFTRWRDGNGALYICTAGPKSRKQAER
jgi:hypothetical protein